MDLEELKDSFGRKHDYLRISVTDRCNLRCVYCMGADGVKLLPRRAILSYEEILRVVKCGSRMGISKIRITGGEPLVRKNLSYFIGGLRKINGIEDISLTTNGIFLRKYAQQLKNAGLDRVNISLDTMKPALFEEMTRGGNVNDVFEGMKAALEYGLIPLKINTVLMKGFNEGEVLDFINMAREREIHVRFIEYMPIGCHDGEYQDHYLPLSFIMKKAAEAGYNMTPVNNPQGAGPAEYFAFPGSKGTVGLIHSISKHFCSSCNRLRLTADGRLKSCLYWQEEEYVRPVLDKPEELAGLIREVINRKPKEHFMCKDSDPQAVERTKMRAMSRTGG